MVEIINELSKNHIIVRHIIAEISENPDSCKAINIDRETKEILGNFPDLDSVKNNVRIKKYRSTLWRFKIDPTKTRPSPEALLRRLLRGKSFPRVNCAVDMVNLASLKYLVCIGLYDLDKLPSDRIYITFSKGGETFEPIGRDPFSLPPGIPVAVSSQKIIHLYPSRDSIATGVTPDTRSLLAIAYGYAGDDPLYLEESLHYFIKLLQLCGCIKTS